MRGRATRVGCAVLAVAGLVVGGCGKGTAAPAAPGAVLSESAARAVVQEYDVANNRVNADRDAQALDRIEAPPLLDSSRAWLRISTELHQEVPTIVSASPRFHLPPSTTRPAWFLAVSTRVRGTIPGPAPTYTIYTRTAEDGRWQAAYSLTPSGQVPEPARAAEGTAVPAEDFGNLRMPPDQLNQAIFQHYTGDLEGKDGFARTPALDDQLSKGYTEGRRLLQDQGTRLTRTLGTVLPARYCLTTADGGALVFSANTVVDVLSPMAGRGAVQLTAGSNNAAMYGQPAGASAGSFTITRLQMFLSYLPPASSGGAARLLAYGEVVTSVVAGG